MKDEIRECATCGKHHKWGILRYSDDNVPLYGARDTDVCNDFRPVEDKLPAFVENAQELWAQTGDLDAQASVATRLVVARLRSLAQGKAGMAAVAAQWPEFLGFVVSQITDMRGSLTRDESKFARLLSHTDEIVIAMEHVVQLSERLAKHQMMLSEIMREVHEMREDRHIKYSAEVDAYAHFGLLPGVEGWTQPVIELHDERFGLDDGRNGSPILEVDDDEGTTR